MYVPQCWRRQNNRSCTDDLPFRLTDCNQTHFYCQFWLHSLDKNLFCDFNVQILILWPKMAFKKMSRGISDRLLGDCVTVTDSLRCREKGHKWGFLSRLRQKYPTVPARRDKTREESCEGFSHWLIMSHSRTFATKPDRSDKPSVSAILIVQQCSVNFNSDWYHVWLRLLLSNNIRWSDAYSYSPLQKRIRTELWSRPAAV